MLSINPSWTVWAVVVDGDIIRRARARVTMTRNGRVWLLEFIETGRVQGGVVAVFSSQCGAVAMCIALRDRC